MFSLLFFFVNGMQNDFLNFGFGLGIDDVGMIFGTITKRTYTPTRMHKWHF